MVDIKMVGGLTNGATARPVTTKVALNQVQLSRLAAIETRIAPLRKRLRQHRIYESLKSLDDVRRFMEVHVFALWDFMHLVKCLHRAPSTAEATCPPKKRFKKSAGVQSLVDEMVQNYANDLNERGERMATFRMYLDAMEQLGAETKCVASFLGDCGDCGDLRAGDLGPVVGPSLLSCRAPRGAADFTAYTCQVIDSSKDHKVAASLVFGRQSLIVDALLRALGEVERREGTRVDKFRFLLSKYKSLYANNWPALSYQVLVELCGYSDEKWKEAEEAAVGALKARIALWDATHDYLVFRRPILERSKTETASVIEDRVLEGLRFDSHVRYASLFGRPAEEISTSMLSRIRMPEAAWKSLKRSLSPNAGGNPPARRLRTI